MIQTDFLVIGSGIAGLSYALKVAQHHPEKKVLVITKTRADETNTKYAQGGIAGVTDFEHDSFDKHIQDTLVAGDGLCNPRTVEIVVTEGPERINEIIEWGTRFDKDAEGDFKLGKEGGHSEFRILHHKDVTGKEIERALLETVGKQKNIELIKHWFVLDLITQHHLGYLVTKSTPDIECYGVYALDQHTNKIVKYPFPDHPAGDRREWPGLPDYDQSHDRHRGWSSHGLPGERPDREHGIHPVPSNGLIRARRQPLLPHHRSGQGGWRHPSERPRGGVHGKI